MNNAAGSFVAGASGMWASVLAFFPKLVLFLVVLVAGYFLSKWIARVAEMILKRVGVERLLEKGGVDRAMANSPYSALAILRQVIFFALFVVVLQLAFSSFGPNPVSDILTRIIVFLPTLFVSLIIVIVSAALARMVKGIVGAMLSRVSYGPVLANVAGAAVFIVGAFAALSHLGIAPAIVNGLFYAALAIVAGSAIVAIGGGGIAPMRGRWEKALQRLEQENLKFKAASGTEAAEAEDIPVSQARYGERTPPRYEPKERSRPE